MNRIYKTLLLLICSGCMNSMSDRMKPIRQVFPEATQVDVVDVAGHALFKSVRSVNDVQGHRLGLVAIVNAKTKSGPYRLVVFSNTQGDVKKICIQGHKNGFGAVLNKPSFLDQFLSCNLFDGSSVNQEFDVVSSATISSRSVVTYLKKSRLALSRLVEVK